MISPPTDRLHKFLAIAGTALFILGVTIPLDRYDQSKRQCIEATAKSQEIVQAQQRLSIWPDSLNNPQQNSSVVAPDHETKLASGVDHARLDIEKARLEREKGDLSVQQQKQIALAQHAERLYAIWLVLGCICILGGMVLAALGFAMWWRQPEGER